jgi:hypothetical protein
MKWLAPSRAIFPSSFIRDHPLQKLATPIARENRNGKFALRGFGNPRGAKHWIVQGIDDPLSMS